MRVGGGIAEPGRWPITPRAQPTAGRLASEPLYPARARTPRPPRPRLRPRHPSTPQAQLASLLVADGAAPLTRLANTTRWRGKHGAAETGRPCGWLCSGETHSASEHIHACNASTPALRLPPRALLRPGQPPITPRHPGQLRSLRGAGHATPLPLIALASWPPVFWPIHSAPL